MSDKQEAQTKCAKSILDAMEQASKDGLNMLEVLGILEVTKLGIIEDCKIQSGKIKE